jgi:hypothetical protein
MTSYFEKFKKIDFQTQCQKWWILLGSLFLNFWLYIAKKKNYKKIAEIKCFLRFSIARIQPKFKKFVKFLYMFQISIQKYRRMYFWNTFSYLTCSQIWLNLPMDGWSPLWLHLNIDQRNIDINSLEELF